MKEKIEKIQQVLSPFKEEIVRHQLYNSIHNIEDVKTFMEHHVFAVWDFMSLLKSLQNNLTCTSIPWKPKSNPETRYLINEIVLGEESDIDLYGNRISHFELYLQAMKECGANTSKIETLLQNFSDISQFENASNAAQLNKAVHEFMSFTFRIIKEDKPHIQAAVFTFGREDLIPDMFISIINELHSKFPDQISTFKYYIERHIEVDGDHHSHLALEMTSQLCGNNDHFWEEAELASIESLKRRKALWDGALNMMQQKELV